MNDVGEGSVVAAGAVVTAPVAPRSIVAGNPARLVRSRDREAQEATT
jgi:acetyltransferase-like isoleucine patch superfamily enzyme